MILILIVSRVFGKSENFQMDLTLDVNTQIYPLDKADRFTMVLSKSLSTDGSAGFYENEGFWDPSRRDQRTLADDYEYVMYGKVYKFDENRSTNKMYQLSFISKWSLLQCQFSCLVAVRIITRNVECTFSVPCFV